MLSRRITYLRKQVGMSQAQLAHALNISSSTEGMYEQGRRTPSLEILVMMSEIFGVSLDYLITGSDHSKNDDATKRNTVSIDCPCNTCFWKKFNTP